MKITKFGHCCLLIEDKGVRVLTDPGLFTTAQNEVKNIDVILITHEHSDHLHIESVKKILENNPEVLIVTNTSVNELLKKENILNIKIVENRESFGYKGLMLSGHGSLHEIIHPEIPGVVNVGYMIGERLFVPGDSFEHDAINPEILALPVAGPWMNIHTALDYCIRLNPKKCFPVHDGVLSEFGKGVIGRVVPRVLNNHGISFADLELNTETDF